jgi:hypothetical protein
MSFTPFTYEKHLSFLVDTLRQKIPNADLSTGSFWQIWAQGQARGLAGVTSGLSHTLRQIQPDTAVGIDLDHHGHVYDVPRLLPAKSSGKVQAFTDQPQTPPSWPPGDLKLVDQAGRVYNPTLPATVPYAGSFEFEVEAELAGAVGNQATDTPMTFTPAGSIPVGLAAEAWVLDPGLSGGRDLEKDVDLQERLVGQVSGASLMDRRSDYVSWVLGTDVFVIDGTSVDVAEVFVYRDAEAPNRVFVLPLSSPPDRIGPPGFLQRVFNAIESKVPLTVDHVVPLIREQHIDMTLHVEPRLHARWDWHGVRTVDTGTVSDRVIKLKRASTGLDQGVDGLEAGMRVLIKGQERAIGHVDHDSDSITLAGDLSEVPAVDTPVYPGGPVTAKVHEVISTLFEVVGPLHVAFLKHGSPSNALEAVITDALMELDAVNDVYVQDPGDLIPAALLLDAPYVEGRLAYLPVPGEITVQAME